MSRFQVFGDRDEIIKPLLPGGGLCSIILPAILWRIGVNQSSLRKAGQRASPHPEDLFDTLGITPPSVSKDGIVVLWYRGYGLIQEAGVSPYDLPSDRCQLLGLCLADKAREGVEELEIGLRTQIRFFRSWPLLGNGHGGPWVLRQTRTSGATRSACLTWPRRPSPCTVN